MRTVSIAFLLAAASLAAGASGQIITTPGVSATFTMNWIEDTAFVHNGDGILEPGERTLIRTTFSFTNQYQYVDFSPPIGSFTRGIAIGLGSAYFDIRSASPDPSGLYNNGLTIPASTSIGPDADSAGTTGYGIRRFYRVAGDTSNGTPVPNGFKDIQPGQFLTDGQSHVQYDDPITNLDRLGWVPISYAARTVNFAIAAAAGAGLNVVGVYLDLDGTTDGTQAGYQPGNTGATAFVPLASITLGSVDIPIAPAPAGFALLGMAGLIACRQRVRAHTEGSP